MTTSISRLSYSDCFEALEKAIADPLGQRIRLRSENECNHLRMRIHQARSIDRKDNRSVYEADHPMYGRSIYDPLVLRIRHIDEVWYLYLEQVRIKGQMQSLTEVPEETLGLPSSPQYQLEYQPQIEIDVEANDVAAMNVVESVIDVKPEPYHSEPIKRRL